MAIEVGIMARFTGWLWRKFRSGSARREDASVVSDVARSVERQLNSWLGNPPRAMNLWEWYKSVGLRDGWARHSTMAEHDMRRVLPIAARIDSDALALLEGALRQFRAGADIMNELPAYLQEWDRFDKARHSQVDRAVAEFVAARDALHSMHA